jgi:small subunit ribosomal protein S16
MLAIRLQRVGRKGYPVYRLIVQDAHRHPSSGRVVAYVGNYNPHTKVTSLDRDNIEKYLSHGAQPTPRVVRLLTEAKIKLPAWVATAKTDKQGQTRFPDKLRRNQPVEAAAPAAADEPAVQPEAEAAAESDAEPTVDQPAAEPAAEPASDEPTAAVEAEAAPADKPGATEA